MLVYMCSNFYIVSSIRNTRFLKKEVKVIKTLYNSLKCGVHFVGKSPFSKSFWHLGELVHAFATSSPPI